MEKFKQSKIITPLQALKKAEAYCAYQERCQKEVRDKLFSFGIEAELVEGIIAELIVNGFLNEERFAMAYVRGKFKHKRWGRIKIIQGLKQNKISEYLIKKAISTIDHEEYIQMIEAYIEKKFSEIKENNTYIKYQKIKAYIQSKGFEYDLIQDCLKDCKGKF